MEIKSIPISKLQTNNGQIEGLPKNPRLIKDEKFKQLVKSIQDDPEMLSLRECIVYPQKGHYVVIAGNMRLQACKKLKYKDVPCKILPKETTIDKLKAYTIKDNIPFAENDWELLSTDWDTEQLIEWGMDVPGFGNVNDLGENFNLPDGDKAPFQQMTFTLADAQAETIKKALKEVEIQEGTQYGNKNSNGNALHQIVLEWAEQKILA